MLVFAFQQLLAIMAATIAVPAIVGNGMTASAALFGAGIGILTMLIRYFGAYPEGMSFAILIMNSVVPLLNKWFHTKKYGRA